MGNALDRARAAQADGVLCHRGPLVDARRIQRFLARLRDSGTLQPVSSRHDQQHR